MNFLETGSKSCGRPHKVWKETLEEDVRVSGLTQMDAEDRMAWRRAKKEMKLPTLQCGKDRCSTMVIVIMMMKMMNGGGGD